MAPTPQAAQAHPKLTRSPVWLATGLLAVLLGWSHPGAAQQAAPAAPAALPALGLDARGVSVSGLSSGGYMAAQFEVAYASSLVGAGIVAGGPYGCSQGSVTTASLVCSCPYDTRDPQAMATRQACLRLPAGVLADRASRAAKANQGHIDGLTKLKPHRVWLYWGEDDPVVNPAIVQDLARFYAEAKVPAVRTVSGPRAGHGMPIASDGHCEVTQSPYLNGCKIDGAGQLLSWIYKLPADMKPGAAQPDSLRRFDQTPYRQAGVFDSLDQTGWVYVPKACEARDAHCKLHVAFHGCEQGQNFLMRDGQAYGTVFVEQAGYNAWAERAGIVVLYPQVVPVNEPQLGTAFGFNPKGCWDFWGYTTPAGSGWPFGGGLAFNRREAPQMKAVKAMIDALLAAPARP